MKPCEGTKCKVTHGKDDTMSRLTLCGLILSLSILGCAALPVQLSGNMGRSILETVAANDTINQTESLNATSNATSNETSNETNSGDLWSWGSIPVGHAVNESGNLVVLPTETDPLVTVPPSRNSGL